MQTRPFHKRCREFEREDEECVKHDEYLHNRYFDNDVNEESDIVRGPEGETAVDYLVCVPEGTSSVTYCNPPGARRIPPTKSQKNLRHRIPQKAAHMVSTDPVHVSSLLWLNCRGSHSQTVAVRET